MQMLGTWLVAFQAVRLDGGRCFKGVHLSQVHQQSCQVPNKTVKCTNFLSVVNIPAWMVHLRQVHQQSNIEVIPAWMVHLKQVHPLKVIPAWMVHLRQVHPLKVTLAWLVHLRQVHP